MKIILFSIFMAISSLCFSQIGNSPIDGDSGPVTKLKIRGTGGVSITNGKTNICPQSSREVCAIIEGSWWSIFKLWWNGDIQAPNPGPTAETNVAITLYEDGFPLKRYNENIEGVFTHSGEQVRHGEIDGSTIYILLKK